MKKYGQSTFFNVVQNNAQKWVEGKNFLSDFFGL